MVLSWQVASTHDDCIGSCGDERIKRWLAITTIDARLHPAKYNCNTLVMLVFSRNRVLEAIAYLKATQMLL